jgi:hypothetical protein
MSQHLSLGWASSGSHGAARGDRFPGGERPPVAAVEPRERRPTVYRGTPQRKSARQVRSGPAGRFVCRSVGALDVAVEVVVVLQLEHRRLYPPVIFGLPLCPPLGLQPPLPATLVALAL